MDLRLDRDFGKRRPCLNWVARWSRFPFGSDCMELVDTGPMVPWNSLEIVHITIYISSEICAFSSTISLSLRIHVSNLVTYKLSSSKIA